MSKLIIPWSEFGFHEEAVTDDTLRNTLRGEEPMSKKKSKGRQRLAGFYEVQDKGDYAPFNENSSSDEICGLDVLGAPIPKRAPTRLVMGPKRPPLSQAQKARIHPLHAAQGAYRSAVKAYQTGKAALATAQKQYKPIVLGAPATFKGRVLNAKQKQKLDAYNAAAKRAQTVAVATAKKAQAAIDQGKKTATAVHVASAAVKAMLAKPPARMGGTHTLIGVDANGLYPGMPGYDPTSDPTSPQYQGGYGGGPGAAPPPVQSVPAPDISVPINFSLPDDAIPYNGEKGWPDHGFASLNRFAGNDGYEYHGDGTGWWAIRSYPNTMNDPNGAKNVQMESPQAPNYGSDQGYGPLIGNPQVPDLANMRWSMMDKKWFWFLEEAPPWATADLTYKANKLQQSQAQADAAAQAAADQAAQQAAADQAAQQAAADFQSSLTQQQSDTAQAQAQSQLTIQQSQFDEQQYEAQAQQQQQLDQAQAAYLQQHPEMMFQQDQGGGGGDGGDYGGLPPAGAPGIYDQASIDQSFQQAEDAGASMDQAQPFNDLPPNEGEMPDFNDDMLGEEAVATNPKVAMLGQIPRGVHR